MDREPKEPSWAAGIRFCRYTEMSPPDTAGRTWLNPEYLDGLSLRARWRGLVWKAVWGWLQKGPLPGEDSHDQTKIIRVVRKMTWTQAQAWMRALNAVYALKNSRPTIGDALDLSGVTLRF